VKSKLTLCLMLVQWVLCAGLGSTSADDAPATSGKKLSPAEVRALLEKGQASGALPEGMVIRVSACLGERKEEVSKDGNPDLLKETWEFTRNQVRRIALENSDDGDQRERVDAVSFDSKNLCRELLDGRAIEIHAEQGTGEEIGFVGSSYARGSRSIEIKFRGETVLALMEVDGPYLKLYRESDAREFGKLYEQLAVQARTRFKSKNSEATTK
jgi:hypothetical protein